MLSTFQTAKPRVSQLCREFYSSYHPLAFVASLEEAGPGRRETSVLPEGSQRILSFTVISAMIVVIDPVTPIKCLGSEKQTKTRIETQIGKVTGYVYFLKSWQLFLDNVQNTILPLLRVGLYHPWTASVKSSLRQALSFSSCYDLVVRIGYQAQL